MTSIQFGIIDSEQVHTDTSNTLLGAKRYATLNGFYTVSCRFNGDYHVYTLAHKRKGKWQYTSYGADLKQRGII